MVGEFLRVKCKDCKNEQVLFENSASEVKCLVCGSVLSKPTGGKAEITAKVVKSV